MKLIGTLVLAIAALLAMPLSAGASPTGVRLSQDPIVIDGAKAAVRQAGYYGDSYSKSYYGDYDRGYYRDDRNSHYRKDNYDAYDKGHYGKDVYSDYGKSYYGKEYYSDAGKGIYEDYQKGDDKAYWSYKPDYHSYDRSYYGYRGNGDYYCP